VVQSGVSQVPPYRIFLSHSADDSDLVQGIRAQLRAIDIAVYLYEEHTEPGRSIPEKLQQAIRESHALVALLTPASAARSFVHDEIGYALGQGKPAVALVTPGVAADALGMLQGEYIPLDPERPLIGIAKLTEFLRDQQAAMAADQIALARQQKQSQDLVNAIVAIALLFAIAYTLSRSSTA
jgi:hypothetical protein